MSALTPFEHDVATWLDSLDAAEPGDLQQRALARMRDSRQRPALLARADLATPAILHPDVPAGTLVTLVLVGALVALIAIGIVAGRRVDHPKLDVVPTAVPAPAVDVAPTIAPGAWQAILVPRVPSSGLTATTLLDGRVLVAGPVAFLVDPATGVSTPADPPRTPRRGAAAVRLADGRVLLVGGVTERDGAPLASAELFDPSTGRWSDAGSMAIARAEGHTATTLLDGRVLVAAGTGWDIGTQLGNALVNSVPSAELFDPRTGEWTATPELNKARSGHTATLLSDGRVLVTGGRIVHSLAMLDAELYDPATGAWTIAASMASERFEHAAVRLTDGSVLVVGGQLALEDDGPSALAERYDPARDAWTPAAPMMVGRDRTTAIELADGRVLVAGGSTASGPTSAAELYDASTDAWSRATSMATARSGHAAVRLDDGSALVVGGGSTTDMTPANGVERFVP